MFSGSRSFRKFRIYATRNGPYKYEHGGPQEIIRGMIQLLERRCNSQLETLSQDFSLECRPKPMTQKQSIKTKIEELRIIATGLANIADSICPTLAVVEADGHENVGDRLTPVPDFEYILYDFLATRIAACDAVLLTLRYRLSRTSWGVLVRQILSLQRSRWPLSASATARIVKQLDECIAFFKVRVLDEWQAPPPNKVSGYFVQEDPVFREASERISVMRWAFYITPPQEERVRQRLLDQLFEAHMHKTRAMHSLESADEMLVCGRELVKREADGGYLLNDVRRWLAEAYAVRFVISDCIEDIDAAIETLQRVLEQLAENHPQRETDLRYLEQYRKTAAKRRSRVKSRRSLSRLHDGL